MPADEENRRPEKEVVQVGYTNHGCGMYSDKFFHVKMQCENGRYITINDPYVDEKDKRPTRWKDKQFATTAHPENAGGGYFGLMGEPFTYVPDRYVEQLPYNKTQPSETRKLGFGTHDASKRDEFTQRIRTEQYRDLLKREKRLMGKGLVDAKIEKKIREVQTRGDAKEREERARCGLNPPRHLYDIGRNRETAFDPHMTADRFYNTFKARKREPRRGTHRTASQDIGDGAWAYKYNAEQHGRSHATRSFYSRGHIEVHDI